MNTIKIALSILSLVMASQSYAAKPVATREACLSQGKSFVKSYVRKSGTAVKAHCRARKAGAQ